TIPPSTATYANWEGALMDTSLTHAIALDPVDWFWATWRKCPPLARPEPLPFDLFECVSRLERAKTGRQKRWAGGRVGLSPATTREEPRFWFEAMPGDPELGPRDLAQHLAGMRLALPIDLGQLRANLPQLRPEIVLPLAHFLSPEAFV